MAQTLLVYDDVLELYAFALNDITIGSQSGYELDLSDQTDVYFTIKEQLTDDDDKAILQIKTTTGLLYIEKKEAEFATDGALTPAATTLQIVLEGRSASLLEGYAGPACYWDIRKITVSGPVVVSVGRVVISLPTTRSLT